MAEIFNNKFFQIISFVLLNILFFIFVFFPSVKKVNTDFPNYYVSANMLLDGKDLKTAYDNVEFNKQVLFYGIENQFVSFVPYPPVNALLMIPFARLEPLTAKLFWNILNYIFFLMCIFLVSKISGLNYFLTGIIFFVSGYAFVNNFFFGQAYLLVLLLLSSSLYFLSRGKGMLSALLFSVSVLLKFYTIFFLLFFLCRKKFRMVLASVTILVVLNLIVFSITGWDINIFYYTNIMPRISDGWVGTVYAPEFQSVLSLLHILFYSEPSLNPDPVIESPQLYFIIKFIFYLGILIASVLSILYFRNKNVKSIFNLQISLFCFVCILLLPVNASYQYVILIPAVAILVHYYISERKFFMTGSILTLFLIMNSPLAVIIINLTKNQPYFFLGYIKLLILLYFWINNIIILKSLSVHNISGNNVLRFSFIYVFLILVLTRMSLARNDYKDDRAENLFVNPNYMISMPSAFNEKIIFTECRNEKFILSSNFGLRYDKENVFDPEFIDEDEINYTTIKDMKIYFRKLETNTLSTYETGIRSELFKDQITKDEALRCYSKDGQIFLTEMASGKTNQITFGNSFNTRPVFCQNDSKIIFCSDRKRGAGFTTLYEININK